jgi:hypothetical protein
LGCRDGCDCVGAFSEKLQTFLMCHLLLQAKNWQVSAIWMGASVTNGCGNTYEAGHASLREDYLNQVQRDFLSRPAAMAGQHP